MFARPPGAPDDGARDLPLGTIEDLVIETGSSVPLTFGPARNPANRQGLTLNQLILEAVRSHGKVQLLLRADGRGGARADFKADLLLDFQLGYSL